MHLVRLGRVAQLAELPALNRVVGGSTPSAFIMKKLQGQNLEDLVVRARTLAENVFREKGGEKGGGEMSPVEEEARALWSRIMMHEAIYGDLPGS